MPTINQGTRLGRYEIRGLLGKGGMGEVYLAQDTELDRPVAVKILPPEFALDPQRLHRFLQEARAASRLKGANVAHIYEIGEAAGVRFIAMELVEGGLLAERIGNQPLAIPELVRIGVEISRALEEAHSKGITHRDIKPSNIMLTPDGAVKVLDFGLARLETPSTRVNETPGLSPTQVMTSPGVVIGTVDYMSPEQAQGHEVDQRSDIFSFGIVLYQMATGRLPFIGSSVMEKIHKITHSQPEAIARLNYAVPPELEVIIKKALRKPREQRYQTVKELLVDLRAIQQDIEFAFHLEYSASADNSSLGESQRSRASERATTNASSSGRTTPTPQVSNALVAAGSKHHRTGIVIAIGTTFMLLVLIGLGWYRWNRPSRSRSSGTLRTTPLTSFPGPKDQPAFSFDGKQIAFVWVGEKGDNTDIYIKLIGEGTPLRLTTDPGADRNPAWSPDGRHIAFIRFEKGRNSLITIPALGGQERRLISGPEINFVNWSPDGKQLAVASSDTPGALTSIFLVAADTGEKQKLLSSPTEFNGDRSPKFSPDGKWIAFIRSPNWAVDDIYLVPVSGGEPTRLTNDTRQVSGLDWTSDGFEIVFSSNRGGPYGMWRVSVSGGIPEPVQGVGEYAFNPTVSRNGKSLAYTYEKIDLNIWRAAGPNSNTKAAQPTEFIASTRDDTSPRYSPDGKSIAFASDRSGGLEIWTCDSDGGKLTQVTNFKGGHNGSPRWSPDSQRIVFDARVTGSSDIYVVSAAGGSPHQVTKETSTELSPEWSADGQWIYFGSDRGGDWQIWKISPDGSESVQVTKSGGFAPVGVTRDFVYYTRSSDLPISKLSKAPGVWRVPLGGGEETQVLDKGAPGTLFAGESGIYFLDSGATPTPAITFYNLISKQTTKLVSVEKSKAFGGGGGVSPDGKWVLFVQRDQRDYDIILVESFQ
jgi:Tol biopolymer transport system component/serine/threonine protein kinase